MLDLTRFATFAIATLILNLTPGPDMMYVIARSVGQGRGAGVVSALGIGGGCLVHTVAAALGIAALLRSSPLAFDGVRYAGAAYLVYLGVRLLVRRSAGSAQRNLPDADAMIVFRQGVVTNILNPKVALFFLAFLPQFASPAKGHVGLQIATLGLYFVSSGTLVNLAVAYLAGVAGNVLSAGRGRALAEKASGGVFVALGLRVCLVRTT